MSKLVVMYLESISKFFGVYSTLESGIDIAPRLNVASGKFDNKNKHKM